MGVAFEILRLAEMLGCPPSGPDMEALVAGVVAEESADVALGLSERCAALFTFRALFTLHFYPHFFVPVLVCARPWVVSFAPHVLLRHAFVHAHVLRWLLDRAVLGRWKDRPPGSPVSCMMYDHALRGQPVCC